MIDSLRTLEATHLYPSPDWPVVTKTMVITQIRLIKGVIKKVKIMKLMVVKVGVWCWWW